jgi:acetyl esterase/lipase
VAAPAGQRAAIGPKPQLLWPDGAPGAKGIEEKDKPTLRIYPPPDRKANGAGVVVCPGGGYRGLAMDHEGHQVAQWLNRLGVAVFVLRYRLAPDYMHPAPLLDVRRAIRFVRHHASRFRICPERVGVMGFSAGGHLASTAATHFDDGCATAADPIDRESCRPSFAILGYPVITFTEPSAHGGSRRNLLGENPDVRLVENLSNEKQVTPETPPTFLFHTSEDTGVPPQNSVLFYLALHKAGVPAELHIYQKGQHGAGLASGDPVLSSWANLLAAWLKTNGFLTNLPRAAVSGEVTVDGEPVSRGWITLLPEGAAGSPAAAGVISRGKFSIPAVSGPAVGDCLVEVRVLARDWLFEPTVPRVQLIAKGPDGKPIRRRIAGGGNVLQLRLTAQ